MSEQQDQHEMMRRTGVEAYSEAIAKMLAQTQDEDMDPAQLELIKKGIVDSIMPPRPLPPIQRFSNHQPIFEHTEDGITTVYDWQVWTARCTHFSHHGNGEVHFYNFYERIKILIGEPAAEFWAWYTELQALRAAMEEEAKMRYRNA